MMFKKIESDKVDVTLTEFIDRYVKDYFLNVDFKANGTVSVFVGSPKDDHTGDEAPESSDD